MDPHQYTAGQDIEFEYAPAVSTAQKKRRKKKKKPAITVHADGQGVTINNIASAAALRGAASAAADNIWNVTASEERMRVRAFWLSLTDAERLDLVQLDKEVLLEKIRKQRQPCSCMVCGRKKLAIEQELEALYKAYYAEIEAFGGRQHDLILNDHITEPQDEDSEYSDYYEQYDEIGGGILSVADDLLKNDGRRFVDVMEHLAAQRIQREVPIEHCDEHDEPVVVDPSLLDEDQQLENEQRLADGRRMLQIFAARMFEQRVLNAYREHVARERQQQLLLEIEEEDQAQSLKEQKKQKDKEKKKDKKRQQRQQREDAERKKLEELELQKQEKERLQQEKVRKQQLDEDKRKAEQHRQEIEARMKRLELEEKQALESKQEPKTKHKQLKEQKNKESKEAKPEAKPEGKPEAKAKSKNTVETLKQQRKAVEIPATDGGLPKVPQVTAQVPAHQSQNQRATPLKSHQPAEQSSQQEQQEQQQQQSKVEHPYQVPQFPHQQQARGSMPLQAPFVGRSPGRPLPSAPSPMSHGPASGLDQTLYRESMRSVSQPISSHAQSSNNIGSPLSLPRIHTPITELPPAQGSSGLSVDRIRPWSRGSTQQQPGPYRQDFARTSAPLYGWNQWGASASQLTTATPQQQQPVKPITGTIWSKNSLWSSDNSSLAAIRQAAIKALDQLTEEGLAADGFVPSQVLFHTTVDALGGTPISQNDLFRACDINSGLSNEFECLRDHVGLVTHVRHVRK